MNVFTLVVHLSLLITCNVIELLIRKHQQRRMIFSVLYKMTLTLLNTDIKGTLKLFKANSLTSR